MEVSQPSGQNKYIKANLVLIEATTTKKKKRKLAKSNPRKKCHHSDNKVWLLISKPYIRKCNHMEADGVEAYHLQLPWRRS